MSLSTIKKVVEFRKKFFHGNITNTEAIVSGKQVKKVMWSYQHLPNAEGAKVQYWPIMRELKESDLIFHFDQKPMKTSGSTKGSLACAGNFKDDLTKWFCIDCDKQKAVDTIREMFLPVLDKLSIEYIWEFSGDDKEEKAHLWIMCDKVPNKLLKRFTTYLFEQAGIDYRNSELELELYPTIKPNNVIRLPGGVHLRTGKVNPILWKGTVSSDASFILDAFIEAKPLTEEFIKGFVELVEVPKKKLSIQTLRKTSKFFYSSRGLALPTNNLPPVIKKVASNCQAINKVISDCMNSSLMQDQKGLGHLAGFYLWRLAMYNDAKSSHYSKKGTEGEEWIRDFTEENRLKPYDSHNWDRGREEVFENPERHFPSCKTWEETFNYCEGCPFKERTNFKSPRQIWHGYPIVKNLVKDVKLVTAEIIRKDTFTRLRNRIFQCLENEVNKDILVASPQGSGKSYAVDAMAQDLATRGFRVLISVPTGDLAMEHKNRIETNPDGTPSGVKAFVVMSHENLFKKMDFGFDCPQSAEINRMYKLGMSSSVWKNAYCKKCPYLEICPYPNQYKKVAEEDYDVVIIQHAHLSCKETLYKVLSKPYDVMFVDEAFIDNCQKTIRPKAMEIEILETFIHENSWAEKLVDWLKKGGYAKEANDRYQIKPTETELENIKYKTEEMRCPWFIPEYIRYFNLNVYYDKTQGFQMFYPLPTAPHVKLRVFTDATPPLEYLKVVIDNEDIEVYGDDEVLDFRKLNKDNKVIQVLDSSMSKTYLKGLQDDYEEYNYDPFCEIIHLIGDLATTEYKDQKILITTYADGERDNFKTVAENYLQNNFPQLSVGRTPPSQVCISHMMIGTNMFEDYLVQFLVAGVYLNGYTFKNEVFRFRNIANYWNRLKERPILPNPFPYGVGEGSSIVREQEPVKRICAIGNRAGIFSFDQFSYAKPADPDFNIVEKFAIARTQQAIRLRFNDDRKRVIYVFGNYPLPSQLVTDSIVEDDLLGKYRGNTMDFS